jgi:hypothetical protein
VSEARGRRPVVLGFWVLVFGVLGFCRFLNFSFY